MKRLLTSAALLLCSMAMLAQFTGTMTDEQGVKYTANNDETTCYVSGHTAEYSSSIVIPEYYDGRRVINIRGNAFQGCKGLTSLTLPAGLTSIGYRAFYGCSGLTSITLPASLTSVGENAFYGCNDLSVTMHKGITSIGERFFYNVFTNCSGVSFVVPESVTTIGNSAFYGCSGLTSITLPDGLTSIGNAAFYGCSGLTSITLPAGLTSIGSNAFRGCSGLTSLTLPTGLTSIENYAFTGCSGLTSITLPDGLTSIGNRAFENCSGLTSIVVDSNNQVYDSRDNCNAIIETSTNTLIAGCKTTVIPNSVTSIGNYAFRDCSGLTSITLPAGLTTIGDWAFGVSGLTSIMLPAGLTSIGECAFENCSGLTSIVVDSNNQVYDSRDNCNAIIETSTNTLIAGCKTTVIPNSVTSIGNSAFYGCSGLTSITLPAGLTSIGSNAFRGCSGLTSLTLPAGLTSIGNAAFYGCSGLTSLSLPAGLTSIGDAAFSNCSGLTSLTLPAGLTSIVKWAFSGCSGLTSITLPAGLTSIGSNAFRGCSGLTSITLPAGLTSIETGAFDGCSGLTSLTLPAGLTSIEIGAFHGCSGLSSIFVKSREPVSIISSVFGNYNASLYVPLGCKAAYEATEVWKDFYEIVEMNLDNYLYADEVTLRPGGKKTIALQLDDVKTLIAGEFRLQLPAGFSIEKDEDGYLKAELVSERDNHHSFEATDEGNGRYHFLCYSGQNRAFKGDSGDFIKLTIVADEDVEENSYSAEVNDIIFSDESEQQVDIDNSTFNISVVDYVPGDANHDGLLNVMDIVKVVGKIMGNPTSDFFFAAADIDDNSKVNVMDLVNLVEIIMNTASQAPAMTAFDQTAAISGGLDLFKADEKTITMNVAGATNHIAAQFYVSLSGKAVLNDVVSDKAHKTEFTRLDDGRYMVMVYSGSNATFKDDCPIKLQVSSDCSAMIEDVVFIDADNAPVAFEAAELGNTQGIMSIGASFEQPADIYSVSGKLIKRGAASTLGLTKGVYVVNNEKIIVK